MLALWQSALPLLLLPAETGWWESVTSTWNSLNPFARSGLVLLAMLLAYYLFKVVVLRALERLAGKTDNDLDDRLLHFARQFAGGIFLFLAVLGVLKCYDVALTPLLAGAGIAGIAVGFAAKEVLADILAGVFLIADRPMRIGDRVKIERIGREWGGWGDVVDIGLRRTSIRNSDGIIVNYPNSVLASSVITNFSFEKGSVRVRVRFQVDYGADLKRAMEVGTQAIASTDGVIEGTAEVVVRSLWDVTRGHLLSGVLLEGRYRIEDVRRRTKIRSRVLRSILQSLAEEGIPLAIPRIQMQASR